MGYETAPQEWAFSSSPKISLLSHRTVPPHETETRVFQCKDRVPITRIADLTPLDPLRLPVFSAITPLARDLTTHMGKGIDAESARVSALMEAVERVSAEETSRPTTSASFEELKAAGRRVVDPRSFDLPFDSNFRVDLAISWVEGWDLLRNESIWAPLDLVVSPPREGVLPQVDTNGLASGNTLLEAVVHGLCEVIERDAIGVRLFGSMFGDAENTVPAGRQIAPQSLSEESRRWIERITATGQRLQIEDITTDIGVAVFRSVLIDHAYPSGGRFKARRFIGFGAGPSAEVAALRSITEAIQGRVGVVQGARDSFNLISSPWRRSTPTAHLNDFQTHQWASFTTVPTFEASDLLEDHEFLLERLRLTGFARALVFNLTRAELGIPVVRVRIPGLTSFAFNRRRIGWRCLRYLL